MQKMNEGLQLWRVYFETPAGPAGDFSVIDVLATDKWRAVELADQIGDDISWMREQGYKSFSAAPLDGLLSVGRIGVRKRPTEVGKGEPELEKTLAAAAAAPPRERLDELVGVGNEHYETNTNTK